jgi:heme/copper-type cytochrome/quinol oxidase subunit 1
MALVNRGLDGRPRKMYRPDESLGYERWIQVGNIGFVVLAVGLVFYAFGLARAKKSSKTTKTTSPVVTGSADLREQ